MQTIRSSLPALVALLVTIALPVHSETVRLSTGYWPPYLDPKSPGNGLAGTLIKEAFQTQGVDVTFQFLPWSRALRVAESPEFQGTAIWSCTDDRAKKYLLSNPILPFRYVFYQRTSDKIEWQIPLDLNKKKIGLTQDYAYGQVLEEAIEKNLVTTETTTSDEGNFRKLLKNRIDLFPMDPVAGQEMINEWFDQDDRKAITFDPTPLREAFYHVLFDKNDPAAERLQGAFNVGLKELHETGEYFEIVGQYLSGADVNYISDKLQASGRISDTVCR